MLASLLVIALLVPMVACSGGDLEETATFETLTETQTETQEAVNQEEVSAMPLEQHEIADLKDYIKILGDRTGFSSEGELMTEWSGSGFEINLNVGEEGTDLRLGFRGNYASRWGIFVDGVQWGEQVAVTTGNKKQIVARGIPAGEHTIRVVKESQPNTNRNNYNNILSVAYNGEAMAKDTADKDVFLEFVGDGYLVGLGNSGNSQNSSSSKILDETNFTRSLPYLTAQALDADYSVVAHSGVGIVTKVGGYDIEGLYGNQYAYRELETFYYPDRTPNAIILHVGMDDTYDAEAGLPAGEFIVRGEQLIQNIRQIYGSNVPIIWLYNTIYLYQRSAEIQAIAERMGGAENGVYALQCEYGRSGSGLNGAVRYSSAEEHQKSADLLVKLIQEEILNKKK